MRSFVGRHPEAELTSSNQRLQPERHHKERVAREVSMAQQRIRELRLVVTVEDFEQALQFYRDVLGLKQQAAFESEGGRVAILDAGRATLELADQRHAEFIDQVEVGRRVAGHIRVAFGVDDSANTMSALEQAGATVLATARRTPWNSLNARLEGAAGLQLTLFSD